MNPAQQAYVMNRPWLFNKPPGTYPSPKLDTIGVPSLMTSSRPNGCMMTGGTTPGISVHGTGLDIMSQINEICEGMYLSSARAIKAGKLRELGITTIINVTIELPTLPWDKIESVKINIEDSPFANLGQYFDRAVDKIEEVRRRGGNTLVHCVAGVSRSASLCIAYLMKYKRMSLRKAYQHVKARRHVIRPNVGFFRQLVDYETRLFGTATVKMVWNDAAAGFIPDLYEPEYNNTLLFLQKYGLQTGRLDRCPQLDRYRR